MKSILTLLLLLALAGALYAADVTMTWQDNSSGLGQEEGFIVERHLARVVPGQIKTEPDPADTWGEIARVPADTVIYTDRTTEHRCYRVAAYTVAGVSEYSNFDCTSVAIPTAPTIMEITDMSFSLRVMYGNQELVLTGE